MLHMRHAALSHFIVSRQGSTDYGPVYGQESRGIPVVLGEGWLGRRAGEKGTSCGLLPTECFPYPVYSLYCPLGPGPLPCWEGEVDEFINQASWVTG